MIKHLPPTTQGKKMSQILSKLMNWFLRTPHAEEIPQYRIKLAIEDQETKALRQAWGGRY